MFFFFCLLLLFFLFVCEFQIVRIGEVVKMSFCFFVVGLLIFPYHYSTYGTFNLNCPVCLFIFLVLFIMSSISFFMFIFVIVIVFMSLVDTFITLLSVVSIFFKRLFLITSCAWFSFHP